MEKDNVETQSLDITADICPLTFVKTKMSLEKMLPGSVLRVRLNSGEPLSNVPRSAQEHGYEVIEIKQEDETDPKKPWLIWIRKN